MTCLDPLERIEFTASIEEGEVVVFRVVIRGMIRVGEPEQFLSLGLVDKGASPSWSP